MANVVYLSKTLLTGGAAPALDSIDGTGLVDGDFAHVTVAGVLYVYKLNATLGGAESIPTIIAPDTNPGNKRWVLQGVNANGLVDNSLTASLPVFTGASKEFVSKSVVDAAALFGAILYPVGSIYTSVVATNPNTLFGFGTWTAFGAGRVPVGLDAGQTEFDTVEETGGAKTHTLSANEMPAHQHGARVVTSATQFGTGANRMDYDGGQDNEAYISSRGGGIAHNNLQPYIVVYMFKRTA